jgi:vancomycin resistance protein VanJ
MDRERTLQATLTNGLAWSARWGLPALWILWLAGQAFRDVTLLTSLLFYIPSPALVVALACGTCYAAWNRQWATAILLAGLAAAPVFAVLAVENRLCARQGGVPDEGALRLVHWNVFGGRFGWEKVQQTLRDSRPDICVLAEIPKNADIDVIARSFGKDWSGLAFGDLAVLARGSLQEGAWLQEDDGVEVYGVVWQSPQGPCRVLVVDLASSVLCPREPRLHIVRKLMTEWRPDIVVGDFNAPRRSRALCPLPAGFVHAYEAVGSGWSYSWPLPCPVYAIDQCIAGDRVAPLAYALESSRQSDHRWQLFDFAMSSRTGKGSPQPPEPREHQGKTRGTPR